MTKKQRLLVRAAFLAALIVLPLFSQGDRGAITGTVTDASGAAVPSAMVSVVQRSTNSSYKVETSSSGDFTLPGLAGGTYQVRVEKPGFKVYITDNVTVVPGGTARVDAKLEVGTAQQSIEVNSTAQMVQTENARVASIVPAVLVDDLPVLVNGVSRSPFDVASTVPEVNTGNGGYQVAGGGNNVGVTLDGASITGDKIGSDVGDASRMFSPSVEALTEFNVEAGGFKAETGHAAGGTISFVSKSGNNLFHGSAFEFLRNQDLDARGFFATTKAVYKQNNFGVTAGGPVWFPKLYNGRNKTFFFASYEGFRNRVGANSGVFYSVPTPEMWTGNFSNWVDGNNKLYTIYDPNSQVLVNGVYQRTPFVGNIIPAGQIDPVAASVSSYLSTLLKPNRPNVALTPGTSAYVRNNFISSGTSRGPSNKWSAKIDENLNLKHHLSYFMNRYWDAEAFGPDGPVGLPYPIGGDIGYNHANVYRGNWDYTISPTLVNRFYGGFNYFKEDHGSPARTNNAALAGGTSGLLPADYWQSKGICIPGFPECTNFPNITTGDFTGWGGPGTNGSEREIFELHDDMTKIKGAHTIQWGYFFNNSHYDGFGVQNIQGTLGFNWDNTSIPGAASQAAGGGSGLASMLVGQVNSFSLDTIRYVTLVYRTHQAYIQDDWKVTRNFTVNIGFRADLNLAPNNGDGRLSDLSLAVPNPAAGGRLGGIVFAGTGPGRVGSQSLIPNWYGKEPRLSFAYALNSKTTIRGSATRYFGPLNGTNGSSHFLGFVVHETLADQSGGIQPLWVLKNGVKYNPPPDIDPGCCNGQNPPYWEGINGNKPPGLLNYAFNVQRQVTGTSVLEVDYLATLASHLPSNFLALNQVPYQSLPAALSPFTTSGRQVLGSLVGSSLANSAGVTAPWSCGAGSAAECVSFNSLWGTASTVTQAMRPYPQFGAIDTLSGGGDRAGHSTYHSMSVKYNKRLGSGLTVQLSYRLSKMLGDADATNGDQYNRRLLKSIMAADQTHTVLFTYAYELPLGKGKSLLSNGGVAAAILGGWRIAGIQTYASGTPLSIASPITFPIGEFSNRAQITTYNGWAGSYTGKFDPAADLYLQPPSFFPTQTINSFGNETRYNPKMRFWPSFNENESLARSISLKERAHLELRLEGFNVLNRTAFGPLSGATTLTNPNWGKWQAQANSARRMQLVAKLVW